MKKIIVAILCILVFPPLALSQTDQESAVSCLKGTKSFICMKKLAATNNKIAQFSLGLMYDIGDGVLKNHKQAVYWYTKPANQGYAPAQYSLGNAYYYGYGVLKNHKQAVQWYTKSAKQGDANAQLSLGFMYYKGYGVEKSNIKAYAWYSIADNGNPNASTNLKTVEKHMSSGEINQGQALAKQLMTTIKKQKE